MHRHAADNLDQADALLFGRVTYEMMEAAWLVAGANGSQAGVNGTLDGALCPDDRRGPTLFAGLSKHVDLKLVGRLAFGSGAVALRYQPRR